MSIKFTEIQNSAEKNKIKSLYHTAIPAEERMPFFWLFSKRKRENVSFFNIYDGDEWAGFVYFSYNNDLIYVWFFAIDENARSKGYGSAVLAEIKRLYPDFRIVLGIEMIDECAENNEQRIKRKRFYERNGFRETDYMLQYRDLKVEFLLFGDLFDIEELYAIFRKSGWFIGNIIAYMWKGVIQKKI